MLGIPLSFKLRELHFQFEEGNVVIFDSHSKFIAKSIILQNVNEIVAICTFCGIPFIVDDIADANGLTDFFSLMSSNEVEELSICQKYISVIHISDVLTEIRGSVQGQLLTEQDYLFSFSELFIPCTISHHCSF